MESNDTFLAEEDHTEDQILEGLCETAKIINRLMIALLALALFSLLAVGQPDAYLLDTAAKVSVPSVGATSAKALLIVGPLLLIGVRVYLQIYVEHWRRFDAMARDRGVKRPINVSPLLHGLLSWVMAAVLYLLVPVVLAAFTWKAMVFPQGLGHGLLFVTVFVFLAQAVQGWSREWYLRLYFCANVAAVVGLIGVAPWLDDLRRPFDLRYADLKKTDLQNADLHDANLRQADLTGADLWSANLRRADLRSAVLEKAILRKADLQYADFQDANLQEADLRNADLRNANFWGASLQGAKFWNTKFQWATFRRTKLQGTNLVNADLQNAFLVSANLQRADLTKANLQGANLRHAKLQGANLAGANLKDANLTGACGDKDTILPSGYSIPDCKLP